jgi:hypothetical protein
VRTFLCRLFPLTGKNTGNTNTFGPFAGGISPGLRVNYRKKMSFGGESEPGTNREWKS